MMGITKKVAMLHTKPTSEMSILPSQPRLSCIIFSSVPMVAANTAQANMAPTRLTLNRRPLFTVTSSPSKYRRAQCISAMLKNTTMK